jgi:RecB family endonuclease NucS
MPKAGSIIARVHDAIAECFRSNATPLTTAQAIAWIGAKYPDLNEATIRAQISGSCIGLPSAYTHRADTPKILLYDKSTRTYRLGTEAMSSEPREYLVINEASQLEKVSEDDIREGDRTFALEAHLRDYLVRNLHIIEPGLKLWFTEPPSVEFAIGGRRIDILARDKFDIPVVIELKLDRAYDRVVGQSLLYRGLISNLLKSSTVRIILVAGEISDELKIACSGLPNLEIFEYSLSMQVQRVDISVLEE